SRARKNLLKGFCQILIESEMSFFAFYHKNPLSQEEV
ncbi:unnamed protein product, partial [marine sediment metagenome]